MDLEEASVEGLFPGDHVMGFVKRERRRELLLLQAHTQNPRRDHVPVMLSVGEESVKWTVG